MTKEGLIFMLSTYLACFVGYWIGRKHENEKSWVSAHKDAENQLEEKDKRIAELEAQIEIMKSCVNCRYCINEKCPWQPKGCGMKHWELKKVKEK